jgi:hypothetical protein
MNLWCAVGIMWFAVLAFFVFHRHWITRPIPANPLKITEIPLDEANRMLRIGFGKNKGKRFIRVDLWTKGYRLSR